MDEGSTDGAAGGWMPSIRIYRCAGEHRLFGWRGVRRGEILLRGGNFGYAVSAHRGLLPGHHCALLPRGVCVPARAGAHCVLREWPATGMAMAN